MSGSLKRALGLWLAAQVKGMHVYADDLANSKHRYPSCTLTELAHAIEPVGCGRTDFVRRAEETGYVCAIGKLQHSETQIRLTLGAPSAAAMHGQERVDALLDAIESSVLLTTLSTSPLLLVDSEANPPTRFGPLRIKPAGRQSVPVDTSGEPFLYRGALTLKLSFDLPIEAPVEHVIERIHLETT